jgi:hypothetical protein
VLVLENGDMQRAPQAALDRVCNFLGITPVDLPPQGVQEALRTVYVPSGGH